MRVGVSCLKGEHDEVLRSMGQCQGVCTDVPHHQDRTNQVRCFFSSFRCSGSLSSRGLYIRVMDNDFSAQCRSKKVGIMFRLFQLALLGYVIGYSIIFMKGYQGIDYAVSTVSTKVKNNGLTCAQNLSLHNCPPEDIRVWDVASYIIPPLENNALFLLTNSYQTPNQEQSAAGWTEDPDNNPYTCMTQADCQPYKFTSSSSGVYSGYV
jgi:hypothetical protein